MAQNKANKNMDFTIMIVYVYGIIYSTILKKVWYTKILIGGLKYRIKFKFNLYIYIYILE